MRVCLPCLRLGQTCLPQTEPANWAGSHQQIPEVVMVLITDRDALLISQPREPSITGFPHYWPLVRSYWPLVKSYGVHTSCPYHLTQPNVTEQEPGVTCNWFPPSVCRQHMWKSLNQFIKFHDNSMKQGLKVINLKTIVSQWKLTLHLWHHIWLDKLESNSKLFQKNAHNVRARYLYNGTLLVTIVDGWRIIELYNPTHHSLLQDHKRQLKLWYSMFLL